MEGGPTEAIAAVLIEGFDRHYRLFRETSAQAKERFERAAWAEAQLAVQERIRFYDERVRENVERLRSEFDLDALDAADWREVKLRFIGLLVDHHQPELAETFFNSVITRILRRTYADNDLIFVRATISTEQIASDPPIYRSYYPAASDLRDCFGRVFRDFGWAVPFADLERDVGLLLDAIGERWTHVEPNHQLQVLGAAFYRNKGAYVLGKIVNGDEELPFAVPVLHDDDGRLALDAIVLEEEQLSILFSLSRAYFMVDTDVPSGTVDFLRTMTPARARADLYTMIGLGKQGKTLFFRDLLQHLHHSEDAFVEAPGVRGQVMLVFTLPSFPYVFKVIKDVFGPGKDTDRATVRSKFELVKRVDRVGRLADTLEFTALTLPLERFSPELLAELKALAPSMIEVEGESLVVNHCYAERRLTPLNIYLDRAGPDEIEPAVEEYGNAIRDLAIANIFPGDLLWRNFGVTRHGRVVFYDYDEIEVLTDINFRRIPPPPNPEAELSAEPWYGVVRNDVFPEEFATFLLGDPRLRETFLRHHADLLEPEFWQECQRRVEAGEIVDFFPYPESLRFQTG
ncbi:MAG: bifunctional isocitrate dehydrogenase kinase/phosphatase [Actinobacteria bacterium]|nr:bifunctional isocitrate dehydrogenase kinase/phosphatase [Actinomycetota bacterium]